MIFNRHPISQGIGWSDDLTVAIHESTGNKWFPQIQSGFFYLAGQEDYLYASEGWEETIIPPGISTISLSSTPDLKAASRSGPIIIEGETINYTRCTANFSAFYPVTPDIVTNDLLSITVSGELALLTNHTGVDMTSVPGTGFLIDRDYYYWDYVNRKVWIARDPNDVNKQESLYVSYLKDRPTLQQEEIVFVDSDGLVRTMFDRVYYNPSGSTENPVIYLIGTGTLSASAVYRNVVYPASSITPNTRVAIRYYIDGSFGITDIDNSDNTTLTVLRSISDRVKIRWEKAFNYSFFDTGIFNSNSLSYVQLNPILTGVSPGFLYLDKPRHPAETLNELVIQVYPSIISSQLRQTVRVLVTAIDSSSRSLPKVPISCWVTDASGNIYSTTNLDSGVNGTDFKGQCHYSWGSKPQMTGTLTVYASALSATGSVLISSAPIKIISPPIFSEMTRNPKIYLYLSPNKDSQGLQDLYAYVTTEMGIPFSENPNIVVSCKLGKFYTTRILSVTGTVDGSQQVILSSDFNSSNAISGFRVGTCKYQAIIGDQIIAYPENNIDSNIIVNYKFQSTPLEIG